MLAPGRILLKISGEALGGEAGFGWDPGQAKRIAADICDTVRAGTQIGLVVGGGNFFRGIKAGETGLKRVTVDSMGMLATVINALAFADTLGALGCEAEVLSAIGMEPLAARYDRARAIAGLEEGRVVIFAAGTGNPFFSTDTAASLRAVEVGAHLLAKATKVDGVYDKDPVENPDARLYEKISYSETLARGLAVMDATAVAMCRENSMPVRVFNLNETGAIGRLARGEAVGTLMR